MFSNTNQCSFPTFQRIAGKRCKCMIVTYQIRVVHVIHACGHRTAYYTCSSGCLSIK